MRSGIEREFLAHVADLPADLLALVCTTSSPSTLALPSVGASRPHKMRISVDLPEPFGPSKPVDHALVSP